MIHAILTLCLFLAWAPFAWGAAAVQFITPTSLGGTYDNTWRTVDLTSMIPGGMAAEAVLVRYRYSAATSNNKVGLRRGDSTDDYQWSSHTATSMTWQYGAIGLDSDDAIDYKIQSGTGTPTVEVMGFFDEEDVTCLRNSVAFTPGNGTFADVDIAASTGGETAIGAIFHIASARSIALKTAWRANGSSDDIYNVVGANGANGGVGLVIVKVDGSEIAEFKHDSTAGGTSARLVCWFTSGITFYDPATDKSTGTTGSYQAVTSLAGIAAYVEMHATANAIDSSGVTKASSDDTYGSAPILNPSLIEITSGQIEQKINVSTQDLFLRATIDADEAPPAATTRRRGQVY